MMKRMFGRSAVWPTEMQSITRVIAPISGRTINASTGKERAAERNSSRTAATLRLFCSAPLMLYCSCKMPPEGVEPPPTYVDMDLNHARLPIPPRRHELQLYQPLAREAKPQALWIVDTC